MYQEWLKNRTDKQNRWWHRYQSNLINSQPYFVQKVMWWCLPLFRMTLSLPLSFSLSLSLSVDRRSVQCPSGNTWRPQVLVSPVLNGEKEQTHTRTQKSINARLALVLADLIFWVNRAMQTWLSARSRYNEQSLISPCNTAEKTAVLKPKALFFNNNWGFRLLIH